MPITPHLQDDRRVDRAAWSVVAMDAGDSDLAYWLSRTPQERLAALEQVRQTVYGYAFTPTRLQRVLEIVERPAR
jgi:hypothetical protein